MVKVSVSLRLCILVYYYYFLNQLKFPFYHAGRKVLGVVVDAYGTPTNEPPVTKYGHPGYGGGHRLLYTMIEKTQC